MTLISRDMGNNMVLSMNLLLRDLNERVGGTIFGGFWLLLHPLFMLALYTLVFGEVLQLRFSDNATSTDFALYLFAGLIVFNAISEVMTRSPLVLTEKRDMLLNTALPAIVLPLIPVLFSVIIELLALLVLIFAIGFFAEIKLLGLLYLLPLLLIRVLFSLALAYFLAPLGVFLRDLRQVIPVVLTVLLFVSPILYPVAVIPERFLSWYEWNLLGMLVEGYRDALLKGEFSLLRFIILAAVASILCAASAYFFRKVMPQARFVL